MMRSKTMCAVKDKTGEMINKAGAVAAAAVMMAKYPYVFLAANGLPDVKVSNNLAQNFGDMNAVMSIVIGLAIWICRITGVGMLIWGIYGYVTARKDGEAEAMNGALGKLISGAVLIGMQGILHALGIVA